MRAFFSSDCRKSTESLGHIQESCHTRAGEYGMIGASFILFRINRVLVLSFHPFLKAMIMRYSTNKGCRLSLEVPGSLFHTKRKRYGGSRRQRGIYAWVTSKLREDAGILLVSRAVTGIHQPCPDVSRPVLFLLGISGVQAYLLTLPLLCWLLLVPRNSQTTCRS